MKIYPKTEAINSINGLSAIELVDETDYNPDTCRNGGGYSFTTRYARVGENKWLVTEHTSGDFCPYCGSFDCCGDCHEDEFRTTEDVLSDIKSFEESEDKYIMAEEV